MKLNKDRIEEFEKYLVEKMEKEDIPGISIAIAHKEDVLYSEGFGYRNKEMKKGMTPNTILGVASVSKSFASLAIAQLIEQEKISYEDSLTKFFPDFNLPGEYDPSDIKVKHLLNHTAGFPPMESLGYSIVNNTEADPEEDRSRFTKDYTVDSIEEFVDFLSNVAEYEMLGKPGEYISYSNDSYGLLGGIIEKITGITFADYVKENIFNPLDMNRSLFDASELKKFDDVTTLYYKKDGEVKTSNNWQEAPPFDAVGWIKTTANDLIKYAQMYANGGELKNKRLLSEKSLSDMLDTDVDYKSYNKYACGLNVQENYNGLTLVSHGGSFKGVSSHFGFIPETNLAVVVLCNRTGVSVGDIWLSAVNAALSLPLETKRREYRNQKEDIRQYLDFEGKYASEEGAEIEIEARLFVKYKNEEEAEIKIVEPNLGIIKFGETILEMPFYRDEKGKAWAIGAASRIIRKLEDGSDLKR
ncbi:MAG: serine hydrolase domain-containing protein [Clostridia bacterium]